MLNKTRGSLKPFTITIPGNSETSFTIDGDFVHYTEGNGDIFVKTDYGAKIKRSVGGACKIAPFEQITIENLTALEDTKLIHAGYGDLTDNAVSGSVDIDNISEPIEVASVNTPVTVDSITDPVTVESITDPVSIDTVGAITNPVAVSGVTNPVTVASVTNPVTVASITNPVTIDNIDDPLTVASVTNPVTVAGVTNPVTVNTVGSITNPVTVDSVTNPVTVASVTNPVTVASVTNPVTIANFSDYAQNTLDKKTFHCGGVYTATSNMPHWGLYNPVGSGKILILNSIELYKPQSTLYTSYYELFFVYGNDVFTLATHQPHSKYLGGTTQTTVTALYRRDTSAAITGAVSILQTASRKDITQIIQRDPIILSPGYMLICKSIEFGSTLSVDFEWEERSN